MLQKLIYFFIVIFLLACSEKQPKQVQQPKIVKEVVKKKKPKLDLINNDNVVAKLTAYGKKNPETIVDIYTTKGKITIRLYKDTPLHRANFILLAKKGYFNGCLFTRVVKNFMAQCGGAYDDKQINILKSIGNYTIPAEIKHNRFHKQGAIGAARSYIKNPNKRSEPDEFYFVEGTTFSDFSLDKYEDENHYKYTKRQRNYYAKHKGAAHIDGEHTVFGEIIKGLAVVSKLTAVKTDSRDWPNTELHVKKVVVVK